jgi:type II secretory pathway component PulF
MTQGPPDAPPLAPWGCRFDGVAFTAHLSGWLFGTVLLVTPCLFVLPRYETQLAEYKAEMPSPTRHAIAAARWVRHSGILLAPIALAHATAVALWYPRANLPQRRLYRLALTLAVCGVFAFVILALFLPLAAINQSLLPSDPK